MAVENFAHVVEQSLAGSDIKHIVITAVGDRLGLRGRVINVVLRNVKRAVPAWRLPHAKRFNARAGARRAACAESPDDRT